jgi:hypothetical protein
MGPLACELALNPKWQTNCGVHSAFELGHNKTPIKLKKNKVING